MKKEFARWKANFYTGLALVLPAIISIAIFKWLFGTIANITDPLLFFVPQEWTHKPNDGPMYWWWSLFALALAAAIIGFIGGLARYYIGKKLIKLVDTIFSRVPLLNKLYVTLKQVNEAFTSSNKTAFKQVVMIEFPKPGIYSLGFITGDQAGEVQSRTKEQVVSVFVPTTPNPTTGFLVLVPEERLTRLDMSVADGIKFIMSLGSIAPDYAPGAQTRGELAPNNRISAGRELESQPRP